VIRRTDFTRAGDRALVEVEWWDAKSEEGWVSVGRVRKKAQPSVTHTVGYVTHVTPVVVCLTTTINDQKQLGGTWTIPLACVQSITVHRKGRQ
jgi:hypothetical protein